MQEKMHVFKNKKINLANQKVNFYSHKIVHRFIFIHIIPELELNVSHINLVADNG